MAPVQISADGHMTLSVFQQLQTCDLHIVLKVEMENPRGKMFSYGEHKINTVTDQLIFTTIAISNVYF